MARELVHGPLPPAQHTQSKLKLVEEILFLRNPIAAAIEGAFQTMNRESPSEPLLDTQRQKLLAMTEADLQALHSSLKGQQEEARKAAAAAMEAARFYNRVATTAEFEYWAKADYWNIDETVALLLGKSPDGFTPAAVEREVKRLTPWFASEPDHLPAGLAKYFKLRTLAERAEDLKGPNINPVKAVLWAHNSGAIMPPAQLVRALQAQLARHQPETPPSATSTPAIAPPVGALAPSTATSHSTKGVRRDVLTPLIEAAQAGCRDPWDPPEVWAQLTVMAERKEPPLLGATEEGLQYLRDGAAAILSKPALKKRLHRSGASRR